MTATAAVTVLAPALDQVLLIRRDEDPFKDLLGLPGGKLETGETFFDAARRELREEVGITAYGWIVVDAFHANDVLMVVFAAVVHGTVHARHAVWHDIDALDHHQLAPNVATAAKAARRIYARSAVFSTLRDSANAITRTGSLIKSSIQRIHREASRTDVGWDHYLQKRRIGTVGTALGLLTLDEAQVPLDRADREDVLDTLLRRENAGSGGWGVRSMEAAGSPSLVESTCFVLNALRATGCADTDPAVSRGLQWLVATQHRDGGWGTLDHLPSRVLPTSLVLRTLVGWGKSAFSEPISSATQWLLATQNADGGWPVRRSPAGMDSEPSTTPHTARAISALILADIPRDNRQLADGTDWLIRHSNGNWFDVSEIEYVGNRDEDQDRLEFKHTAESLAVTALLDAGVAVSEPLILSTIRRFAENATRASGLDGQPIWVAFDRVSALSTYVRMCMRNDLSHADDRLSDPNNALSKLSRFYEHHLQVQAASIKEPEPTRDHLIFGIRRHATSVARCIRWIAGVLFILGVTWASPYVFRQWPKYEPIVYIVSFAVSGVVVLVSSRSPQAWALRAQALLENWIISRIAGPSLTRLPPRPDGE